MDKKRICLVIPSLQAGGMERVMSEFAAYLAAREDTQVHLVLYGIDRSVFYPIPENVEVHKPLFRFNNTWRFISTVRTLIFLRRKIRSIDPFSILSFGEYWNSFVLLSLTGSGYRVFVSDRSQPDKSLGWIHDRLRLWLYRNAEGLIFQTEKAKEIFLRRSSHGNMAVIGNPIRESDSGSFINSREKIVLMVGRLIKSKNQDKLIEMFAKVGPADWKLYIAGYDHLKQNNLERLVKLAEDLKVADRVVFTGKTGNVDDLYLRSSIFAFTSESEGFPNVIGEAMAAGLPVVAFDCVAGPSEMIEDGYNGYLVPLHDYDKFESKLTCLINDESLRKELGSNAVISIRKFSAETICDSFYRFISSGPEYIS